MYLEKTVAVYFIKEFRTLRSDSNDLLRVVNRFMIIPSGNFPAESQFKIFTYNAALDVKL